MSSTGVAVTAPTTTPTSLRNYPLQWGGYFSLAFAIFQFSGIWWPTNAVRYLGGPAAMKMNRPLLYAALCIVVAAGAAVFGLYALSGAGKVRRLPLLRTGLVIITVIYLLRALLIIQETPVILRHPELVRFLIFSLVSLCVGVVHAVGTVKVFRHGRAG